MAVYLTHLGETDVDEFDGWAVLLGWVGKTPGTGAMMDLEMVVDRLRMSVVPQYLELCRQLAAEPGARLAHTPSAAVNASDLLEMMAWTAAVDELAADTRRFCIFCDDPWLYRHLLNRPGISGIKPPSFGLRRWAMRLRGWAARLSYALRTALHVAMTPKPVAVSGGTWLLSYPHPEHDQDNDAYFGDLAHSFQCRRVLHVDGGSCAGLPELSSWGRMAEALLLPAARWRPSPKWAGHWLVRRAAALESASAQAPAIRWQMLCQAHWLDAVRPDAVAWPWENHGWERELIDRARQVGCRTLGYQHTVIGRTEFNHHAMIDGSLPDRILCTGTISRDQLLVWGHQGERLAVGGALRYREGAVPAYDPTAPVFMALPGNRVIARQMIAAAEDLGRLVLVRPHPVYDLEFIPSTMVRRADGPLASQRALSAVVYAATTVGLEAVVAGLPTIRFVPRACISLDILPNNVTVPAATANELAAALAAAVPPSPLKREELFAPVDRQIWRSALLEVRAS